MSSMGKFTCKGLDKFQKNINKFSDEQRVIFMGEVARELAARMLSKAIKATPVGDYPAGKMGGTLRRGWTAGEAAQSYAQSLNVVHSGDKYTIEITNPVEYASYVEFGHRTSNGGFVEGRHMLTIAEAEIDNEAPSVIINRLKRELGALFDA